GSYARSAYGWWPGLHSGRGISTGHRWEGVGAMGRYCMRCGSRLARESRVSVCAPCRQASGIGSDQAPELGQDFWHTDQMRDAFATRDMGTVLRAYRYHPAHGHRALSQETVSRWLGTVTQSQLRSEERRVGEGERSEGWPHHKT